MTAALNPAELRILSSLVQQLELARRTPLPGAGKSLFHIEHIDLTSAAGQLPASGFGLVALKNGSNPGARLKIEINGTTELRQWAPGSSFTGAFDAIKWARETGCARIGTLEVLVLDSPLAGFLEADVGALQPVALLGSRLQSAGGAYTFVTVAEDTAPASSGGGAPNTVTGAFDVSGFQKIRVLIDGLTAAANFVSADLVPWTSPDYVPGTAGTWFSQDVDRVTIPAPDADIRYRAVELDVAGVGFMFLEVRNLLAAARTGLGFYIEGIE